MKCDACAADLEPDASQCPSCGKAVGAANRCERCHNVSGVVEVSEGRYQCAACGGVRVWLPGMTVRSDYADQLSRQALIFRAMGYGGLGVLGLLGAAVLLLGAVGRAFGVAAGPWVMGAGLAAWVGAYGAFRWFGRRANVLGERSVRSRLVGELSSQPAGHTVRVLAEKTSTPEPEMDVVLTNLAKQGILDLRVTDEGEMRYRLPLEVGAADTDFMSDNEPTVRRSRLSED